LISSSSALESLLLRLAPLTRVALDTEADSLHCYFEKICLIQVGLPEEHLLVDPLAGFSLQPLYDLLAPKTLVMHGSDYDLRLFARTGQFEPSEVIDTMIAARLIGLKELGLAALVQKYFDVTLSKASQKANWGMRPLSDKMVEYARNDTRYLLELASILEAELRRLERWDWFTESCARVMAAARDPKPRDDAQAWRITGSSLLSPRAQAIVRALWIFRDAEARRWDRPPFHVIGNAELLAISAAVAEGKPFSTPRFSTERRRRFDQALAVALSLEPHKWPEPVRGERRRPSKTQLDRFEELRKIRDTAATSLQLDPSILASRSALESLAFADDASGLMNWQLRLLGPEAMGRIEPSSSLAN